jgi:hypothetical protein
MGGRQWRYVDACVWHVCEREIGVCVWWMISHNECDREGDATAPTNVRRGTHVRMTHRRQHEHQSHQRPRQRQLPRPHGRIGDSGGFIWGDSWRDNDKVIADQPSY